jgi:D-sedoheptulose 7-phosphate isomerase
VTAGERLSTRQRLVEVFRDSRAAHDRFLALDPAPVVAAVEAIVAALVRDGKVLAFGNGGSAADAQHLAAELVGRFVGERPALAAVALTTDTSVLTGVSNDYGYERVFARQIEALGRPGDVAVGITTSGASPNVMAGLQTARRRGLATVALTGRDGGEAGRLADIHVNVPDPSAPRVQEVHRTIIHALVEMVERALTDRRPPGA